MRSGSVTDVKNNLSKYLELVKSGESVLSIRAITMPRSVTTHLARLERAGVIHRGRPVSRKLINEPPPPAAKGASAVQALLDERRTAR
jgi:hypothetical protein